MCATSWNLSHRLPPHNSLTPPVIKSALSLHPERPLHTQQLSPGRVTGYTLITHCRQWLPGTHKLINVGSDHTIHPCSYRPTITLHVSSFSRGQRLQVCRPYVPHTWQGQSSKCSHISLYTLGKDFYKKRLINYWTPKHLLRIAQKDTERREEVIARAAHTKLYLALNWNSTQNRTFTKYRKSDVRAEWIEWI